MGLCACGEEERPPPPRDAHTKPFARFAFRSAPVVRARPDLAAPAATAASPVHPPLRHGAARSLPRGGMGGRPPRRRGGQHQHARARRRRAARRRDGQGETMVCGVFVGEGRGGSVLPWCREHRSWAGPTCLRGEGEEAPLAKKKKRRSGERGRGAAALPPRPAVGAITRHTCPSGVARTHHHPTHPQTQNRNRPAPPARPRRPRRRAKRRPSTSSRARSRARCLSRPSTRWTRLK